MQGSFFLAQKKVIERYNGVEPTSDTVIITYSILYSLHHFNTVYITLQLYIILHQL